MIEIRNLNKTYKLDNGETITALKDINLNIKEGEILGIIGRSGSGKTSLLRILRGVEDFDSGSVKVNDLEVKHDSSKYYFNKLKKETAIHLQRSFGLWPESVYNNVIRKLYGAKYGDEATIDFDFANDQYNDEARKLLEMVGLEDKIDHYAPVLSGGEKQRLIIARQLAKKPKILLLDEPATMACPKTKQSILKAIKNINKELKVTVVLVSHLPEVHQYLSDRLILLKDGEIKDDGNPKEVVDEFLKNIQDEIPLDKKLTDNTLIKVKDVYKRYYLLTGGNVLEMKDVSFDVNREDILSLVGSSGAGKTILLRMIGGLDQVDDGKILFKTKDNDSWIDISKPSIERMNIRKNLGFMHQEFALTHYSTIKDQIAVKLGFKNQDTVDYAKKKAKEEGLSDEILDCLYQLTDLPEIEAKSRLEQAGLLPKILNDLFPKFPDKAVKAEVKPIFDALDLSLDILNRRSYELSGGQKVRATLALAICSKPDILMLDEPFGDLDPLTLRIVANSIKTINKELGTTILMISHNINFIEELSKRTVLIEDGKLVGSGDPWDVLDKFKDLCNAEYLQHN
ncbi:MAG: ATP-binding cassette domain-containing protein [Methanobrevibacter sp.]|jgi:methyl coenzyme M reductase system subunit A2|nr:ATP-binding cassette domain-containing protein [Candidatus Methanovirga basalitermitum]